MARPLIPPGAVGLKFWRPDTSGARIRNAWNVEDKQTTITLSNSDKTAATISSGGAVRSATSYLLGTDTKYYAEFACDSGGANDPRIGVKNKISAISSNTNSAWVSPTGIIFLGATSIGNIGSTFTSSDVICLAFDLTAKRIWYRKNNDLWNDDAAADPGTGVNGLDVSSLPVGQYSLWMWVNGANTCAVTVRTEVADFTYTVPSGFTSWMGEALPEALTVETVGIADGVGDASAVGETVIVAAADGAASGTGTATAVGETISVAAGDGSAAGIGEAAATGNSTGAFAGSAAGTGAASTTGVAIGAGAGTTTGVGTASAEGSTAGVTSAAQGTAAGIGTASATGTGIKSANASTASGLGAATATATATAATVGDADGIGAASGVGFSITVVAGAGDADGVGAASATGRATGASAGDADGTGTAAATATATAVSVGTATGTGAALALSDPGTTTGEATGQGTAAATGRAITVGIGAASGVGAASATGAVIAAGVGTASGVGSAAAVSAEAGVIVEGVGSAIGVGTAHAVGRRVRERPSGGLGFIFRPGPAVIEGVGYGILPELEGYAVGTVGQRKTIAGRAGALLLSPVIASATWGSRARPIASLACR